MAGIKALVLDLDGCVYFGEQPAEGAAGFIQFAGSRGLRLCFISNNSSDHGETIRGRLERMGIRKDLPLLTPLLHAGEFVSRALGENRSVCVLGSAALRSAVECAGHTLTDAAPDVVLLGRDESFCYEKLRLAGNLIRNGARFLITNGDLNHPSHRDTVPETGALAAAITAVCGVRPTVIGKPEPFLFDIALEALGVTAGEALMIGDSLGTDILGGWAAGMRTALIHHSAPPCCDKHVTLTASSFHDLAQKIDAL